MIEFDCPHCRGRISAPEEHSGYYSACPHCLREILIGDQDHEEGGEPVDAVKSDPRLDDAIAATPSYHISFSLAVIAGLICFGLYGIFYGVVFQIIERGSGFFRLVATGWVPYACIFLFCWSISIILIKVLTIKKYFRILDYTYLPRGTALNGSNEIDSAISAIHEKSRELKDTMLAQRIIAALNRFKLQRSLREVEDILREEADKAFSAAESSYTLLRVIVWATPILGFIGTVQGVSKSVGGLGGVLGKEVEDISQITNALGIVTSNLAFAFDTTLIALVLTVVVMVFMSMAEQFEFRMLASMEVYGEREVLPRLPIKVLGARSKE